MAPSQFILLCNRHGVIAVPTGILAAAFSEAIRHHRCARHKDDDDGPVQAADRPSRFADPARRGSVEAGCYFGSLAFSQASI
jgi:hypothetical protein